MASVMIATRGSDPDATFVAAAIRAKGHRATQWLTADFPSRQTHSFEFDGSSWHSRISDSFGTWEASDFDTVWFRRPTAPFHEPITEEISEADLKYVSASSRRYWQGLWHCLRAGKILRPGVFWVNDHDAVHRAESKMLQLEVAARVGFRVPATLVSNDREQIRKFIASMPCIRKSFVLFHWIEERKSYSTMTTDISPDDLIGERPSLPYCEIFQEKILKAAEIRAFVFGRTFFAVEISDPDDSQLVDFRVLHSSPAAVRLIELPEELKRRTLALLQELGLVSAVVEIMVTQSGELVFTEVNQGGQFLWITQHFPDSAVLDAFTEFLVTRDPHFDWGDNPAALTVDSVRQTRAFQELLEEEKTGLYPPPFWRG